MASSSALRSEESSQPNLVPLALAVVSYWFTVQQEARQQQIEDQRAEQATLQAYPDQMGTLLLDRALRAADQNSDVRRLARAGSLVVLDALGPSRQERAMRFLYEAELIQATPPEGRCGTHLLVALSEQADEQGLRAIVCHR